MGVSDTVRATVDEIVRTKSPTLPRHLLLVELLRLMPLYRAVRNLAAWDAAFRGALAEDDDGSELGRLLLETFEFGCENLYGRFDAAAASRAYERLSARLREGGVPLVPAGDLTDW